VLAPTGPVIVAEQLPDSNPVKKVGLEFRAAHLKANNVASTDAFSAYSFDGWLVFAAAAKRALATAQPGTAAFRSALRDELYRTKELVGSHGVYNYTQNDNSGVDERARVIVTLEKGQWKLLA
jgi:ABC-type branched-chain amino acid transport systems, periplasmic component